MKIEIRPIERPKWHQKKGKESFTVPKTIYALVDVDRNEYATGLTEEDISFLKNKGIKYDLSPYFDRENPHTFWDSPVSSIKLKNSTMFLDTENPLDFIKYKILEASKFVANSKKEFDEGMFSEATHIIFNEREEIEVKAAKVAIKKRAIVETSKLSKDKKIQLILILSGKNLKGKSDDFVEVELNNIIEENSKRVLTFIKRKSEDLFIHALILEALQKSVLRKESYKILYHDSVIGQDIEEVIDFLKNPKNQDLKLRIMAGVN